MRHFDLSPLYRSTIGFDRLASLLDASGLDVEGNGYPPYNIERIARDETRGELLRITLAVAGFTRDAIEITLEDRQLTIRGKSQDDKSREFLYRGIAARQFQRTFVLAEGIEVLTADLANGLLSVDLVRREPERMVRRIAIGETNGTAKKN